MKIIHNFIFPRPLYSYRILKAFKVNMKQHILIN